LTAPLLGRVGHKPGRQGNAHPTAEPIMMMRPPSFICLQRCLRRDEGAADVDVNQAVQLFLAWCSSNVFGMAVPALFTSTSSRQCRHCLFDAASTAQASSGVRLNWRSAFRPSAFNLLTTDAAASAPFVICDGHVRSVRSRRLAIAAPIPREPPVTSCHFFG